MKGLIEFELENGGSIVVQIAETEQEGTMRVTRPNEITEKAKDSFEKAVDKIKPIANTLISRLHSLTKPADEVGVEFGIKLNGKYGAIITEFGAEAQFKISLKWKCKE